MKEPIEGQFSVIGEKPGREPVIRSWPDLWTFLAGLALVIAMKLLFGALVPKSQPVEYGPLPEGTPIIVPAA